MIPIHPDSIGGAKVVRTFTAGNRRMRTGDILTGDEVRAFRPLNRSSLIDKGYIAVWPKEAMEQGVGEKFVRSLGFGRYDVIEGRKLNDAPLDREEAHALAGIPLPANGEKPN